MNSTEKYYTSQDMHVANVTHIFDKKTMEPIGNVTKLPDGRFKAYSTVTKEREIFAFDSIAKGWIASLVYNKRIRKKKGNEKQLSILL
jgi:hypothetical protein